MVACRCRSDATPGVEPDDLIDRLPVDIRAWPGAEQHAAEIRPAGRLPAEVDIITTTRQPVRSVGPTTEHDGPSRMSRACSCQPRHGRPSPSARLAAESHLKPAKAGMIAFGCLLSVLSRLTLQLSRVRHPMTAFRRNLFPINGCLKRG